MTVVASAALPATGRPIAGIGFKIASTFMFTVMLTLIKLVSTRFPIGEIVFCRSLFALIPLFIWVGFTGRLRGVFLTANVFGHVKRSLAGTAAIFLNFGALFFLPIADATAISYSMPLITVLLAVVMLDEDVRLYRWLAIAAGFVGVLIILSGYLGQDGITGRATIGAMLAIAGSFAGALAIIQIRTLARLEAPTTIVVYFSVFTTLAGAVTAPFGWVAPDAADAIALVSIGIAGGIAQLLVTQSYHYTGASVVAPFEYTSMLWALAVSWVVFDTWPGSNVFFGSAVVILAGLFVVYRERSLRSRPRQA